MDLHDFADVAMNYDYYFPVLGSNKNGFEEFHMTLALKYGTKTYSAKFKPKK